MGRKDPSSMPYFYMRTEQSKKENHRPATVGGFLLDSAPSIPGVVLLEPYGLGQSVQGKPARIPFQQVVLCLVTFGTDPQGLAHIQGEHFHEVLAIYLMLMLIVGNSD